MRRWSLSVLLMKTPQMSHTSIVLSGAVSCRCSTSSCRFMASACDAAAMDASTSPASPNRAALSSATACNMQASTWHVRKQLRAKEPAQPATPCNQQAHHRRAAHVCGKRTAYCEGVTEHTEHTGKHEVQVLVSPFMRASKSARRALSSGFSGLGALSACARSLAFSILRS